MPVVEGTVVEGAVVDAADEVGEVEDEEAGAVVVGAAAETLLD